MDNTKMTIEQFGATVKEKYPAYASYSDAEIGQKMLTKYPQYQDKIQQNTGQALGKYDVAPVPVPVETPEQKNARIAADDAQVQAYTKKNTGIGNILKNTLKGVGNTISSSEQALGKTIGMEATGPQSKEEAALQKQLSDRNFALTKIISDKKASGADSSADMREYNSNVDTLTKLSGNLDRYTKDLPTTGQALGQLGGTALDVLSAGTYGKAAAEMKAGVLAKSSVPFLSKAAVAISPELAKVADIASKPASILTKKGVGQVATGAGIGYASDVTQGLQGNRGENRTGAKALIPGMGTIIGASIPAATGTAAAVAERKATAGARASAQIDKLIGEISQEKDKSKFPAILRSLGDINVSGVKTQQDLVNAINDKVEGYANKLDEGLGKMQGTKTLDQLTTETRVGNQTVKTNHVKDALDQLEELYTKTNNAEGIAKIRDLRQKATTAGLSVKEINDLSRLHGEELNAFNANGEAASGLNKQAAENTRQGLKSTARGLFNNPVYEAADQKMSELLDTKKLAEKNAEEAQKLTNKIKDRTLGEQTGRVVGKIINTIGLNSPKGLVEYFLGRGTGLKTLNALDLQAALSKNLAKLQALSEKAGTMPEKDLIKELEQLQPSSLHPQLPAPKGTGTLMKGNANKAFTENKINLPGEKGPTTYEPAAQKINRQKQPSQLLLPPANQKTVYGPTVGLPAPKTAMFEAPAQIINREKTPGQLLLPPGKEGTIPGATVRLPNRSQSTIDAIERKNPSIKEPLGSKGLGKIMPKK